MMILEQSKPVGEIFKAEIVTWIDSLLNLNFIKFPGKSWELLLTVGRQQLVLTPWLRVVAPLTPTLCVRTEDWLVNGVATGVYSSRDPVFFPSLQPETHRGTIILPYVQKNLRAFAAQFTTFHIFGAPLTHNCQLLTILYRVDPPHYWFLLHF